MVKLPGVRAGVPPAPTAILDGFRRFDKEAASKRRVGLETDLELPQEREEIFLNVAGDWIIVPLIDGR